MTSPAPVPGFLVLHCNRTEYLLDALAGVLERHRLAPLEPETILVQSNGIAEWLKMEFARRGGICAAARVELPAQFQWQLYRRVLGGDQVPERSPLDEAPLAWRLMRLLEDLPGTSADREAFEPLAGYLAEGDPHRRHQLALRIADLYDQYQVHRPDWLEAWADGREVLRDCRGIETAMPHEQRWQSRLWQRVLAELDPTERALTRSQVHQQVLARLDAWPAAAASGHASRALPRRVVLFGMTHLAPSTLLLLAALSRHSQVVLAIPNPCRFHWADIIDGRELLQGGRRRHPLRNHRDLGPIPLEQMHLHAHPLLAAWGRQARDFVRQLDEFDDAEAARERFAIVRPDLFDEDSPSDATLLEQVQNHIRDLLPLAEHPQPPVASADRSIVFHVNHSPLRELEVLHDHLLELLASPPGGAPLRPRDIVVMVPVIDDFAPAIRAVFGQYDTQDPRHIAFDIADLSARGSSPLLSALQWVLRIPHERCRLSDLCALFDVPAVAARFDLEPDSVPRLTQWMEDAGIRWGLTGRHRAGLDLEACGDTNTALFGLRRMLMGYAVGANAESLDEPFAAIEPYSEVGGLEAALVGALEGLIEVLMRWLQVCRVPASPMVWAMRLRALLGDLFKFDDERERGTLAALDEALARWLGDCETSGFDADLPLAVVSDAWLGGLDAPSLGRRFRARGVTFCTLMPMRAIPFEVVCLLGMNDSDYPRRSPRTDFDLIGLAGQRRPGDRARRDDDRQMMLEALLSARRVLYLSWCGRSARDDSRPPPSVLVSQLRDYLSAGWSKEVVDERTTEHPLQPFSRRYFEAGSPLYTHAREWRNVHAGEFARWIPGTGARVLGAVATSSGLLAPEQAPPLTIARLARVLRNPAKIYFEQRLGVIFDEDVQALPDAESFGIDGLERHRVVDRLACDLLTQMRALPLDGLHGFETRRSIDRRLGHLVRSGALPLRGPGEYSRDAFVDLVAPMIEAWRRHRIGQAQELERLPLHFEHAGVVITDWLDHRYASVAVSDRPMRLEFDTNAVLLAGKTPVPRPDRLLATWVSELLAAASDSSDPAWVVARDCTLRLRPVSAGSARDQLITLIAFQQQALTGPLPVAAKTALALIGSGSDHALRAYEGDEYSRGEVEDPVLARCFPDFEALAADGRFEQLARQIYAPLLEWVEHHVDEIEVHPQSPRQGAAGGPAGDD